jgi:raffinose/stachyose/melibiose transport system permease protein
MIGARNKRRMGRAAGFVGMTAPAVIAILLFVEIPFFMSITYSFTKWNGLDKGATLVGLANYVELLTNDRSMGQAFLFTLLYTAVFVLATNVVALALAVALNVRMRGRNLLRAAFYIPNIISLIIIGYVWRFIFSRGFDSLYELTHIGLFRLSWLGRSDLAFLSVVLVSVWQAIGFYMVIYIAGLQTVPREQL